MRTQSKPLEYIQHNPNPVDDSVFFYDFLVLVLTNNTMHPLPSSNRRRQQESSPTTLLHKLEETFIHESIIARYTACICECMSPFYNGERHDGGMSSCFVLFFYVFFCYFDLPCIFFPISLLFLFIWFCFVALVALVIITDIIKEKKIFVSIFFVCWYLFCS